MRIEQDGSEWVLVEQNGEEISRHATNAKAWRAYDKAVNAPLNKQQQTADWAFNQRALS